jgi:hypothetical protein
MTPRERVLELVAHYGYWWKTAEVLGIGQPCLHDIVSGRTKEPTPKVLAALGLEKVITYRLVGTGPPAEQPKEETQQTKPSGRELLEAAKQRARISCTDTNSFFWSRHR